MENMTTTNTTASGVDQLGADVRSVLDSIGDAVVSIGRRGRGSGVITAPGVVVTNAHNLHDKRGRRRKHDGEHSATRGHDRKHRHDRTHDRERDDSSDVTVVFSNGEHVTGTVAGFDPDGDLAVIRVETADRPTMSWSSDPVQTGDTLFALAGGRGATPSITVGMVSATDRTFRGPRQRPVSGSIEHTAPLPRGASGGPIVDRTGQLLGIDTHRLDGGFYLAQPATETLHERISALTEGRTQARASLGVGLAPPVVTRKMRAAVGLPEVDGLITRLVADEGPAARADLRVGDVIVTAAGEPMTSLDDLQLALEALGSLDGTSPAPTLELGIVRATDELTITVTFDNQDEAPAS